MAVGKPAAISKGNIMITTVLFDLDGTLLPMELDSFLENYFKLLISKLSAHGYEPQKVNDALWEALMAMIANDGSKTNEEVFWPVFNRECGKDARADIALFEEFYNNEFEGARASCGFDLKAVETVAAVKAKGLRVVLATSPLYPAIATQQRLRWAGFKPEDFELYTTYENYHYCKPNPGYYHEVLRNLGLKPEECLMVGNDAIEDMVAATLGIHVFLLPKWLVNRKNLDISAYPQGDFDDLLRYIDTLTKKD